MVDNILRVRTPVVDNRPVYLSGNFCSWNPAHEDFLMKVVKEGIYEIDLKDKLDFSKPFEYKYTKGSWDNVELDYIGNTSLNRKLKPNRELKDDIVPLWRQDGLTPGLMKYLPIIETLDNAFEIPQLSRIRKISVLLPYDYYQKPEKRYPVVYMLDGQNLYGSGSGFGNWEIDLRMSLLKLQSKHEVIIVAINHAEDERDVEFSPYRYKGQKGLGKKFVNFIVRNLKQAVDKKYRTLSKREFTGIGGSSMGGLISIYAGIMYPEVIGRLMVFSPLLCTSPKIYFDAVEFLSPVEDTRLYLYGGGNENESMVPNLEKLKTAIDEQGFSLEKLKIKFEYDPHGIHSEKRWGQEFPKAIDWLFY